MKSFDDFLKDFGGRTSPESFSAPADSGEEPGEECLRAREKAVQLLSFMDRSSDELRRGLRKRGFSEEAVGDAIRYVRGLNYLNDERYAENYVNTAGRRRSRLRVSQDLAKKGIDRETIRTVMAAEDDGDERPLIRRLAEKKLRSLPEDDPKRRQKTAQSLLRKGFRAPDVFAVLDEIREDDARE